MMDFIRYKSNPSEPGTVLPTDCKSFCRSTAADAVSSRSNERLSGSRWGWVGWVDLVTVDLESRGVVGWSKLWARLTDTDDEGRRNRANENPINRERPDEAERRRWAGELDDGSPESVSDGSWEASVGDLGNMLISGRAIIATDRFPGSTGLPNFSPKDLSKSLDDGGSLKPFGHGYPIFSWLGRTDDDERALEDGYSPDHRLDKWKLWALSPFVPFRLQTMLVPIVLLLSVLTGLTGVGEQMAVIVTVVVAVVAVVFRATPTVPMCTTGLFKLTGIGSGIGEGTESQGPLSRWSASSRRNRSISHSNRSSFKSS